MKSALTQERYDRYMNDFKSKEEIFNPLQNWVLNKPGFFGSLEPIDQEHIINGMVDALKDAIKQCI